MKQTLSTIIGLTICLTFFGQSVDDQLTKAEGLFESGKYQEAIRELTQLFVMDKNNADAYLLRGICYSASGDVKSAGADYNKAIELSPTTGRYYYNRGLYYNYQGKTKKALKDYNKAIEFDPNAPSAYYNRAIIYDNEKDYAKSIPDYTKAIELAPDNADMYNNRGLAYKNSNQLEKAINDYSKAIEINPDYSMAYYNRARVKGHLGDIAGACDDFKIAADLGNKGAKNQYDLNCKNLGAKLTEYIKEETIGGELDFNKVLEKEEQAFFLHDSVAYNKKDFAFYLWGKKVKMLGLKSSDEAIKIYEEVADKQLTDPEKKAITNGFKNQ